MKSDVSVQLHVDGMVCSGCEMKIEKKVGELEGVRKVKASFKKNTVWVTYDYELIQQNEIKKKITDLEYEVSNIDSGKSTTGQINYVQLSLIVLALVGTFLLLDRFGGFAIFNYFPKAREGMGYATLLLIGLLTSVHCIGMCGGINLSQCINVAGDSKTERLRPSFLYNLGRVISYTVIGGIVGGIGSVISFIGMMRGAVALFAGVFMVIMGLNMLHLFPWLRRFGLKMPKFLFKGLRGKSNSPLYVGLLNGLMPCGPLQSMQLFALSTEDPIKGALSMLAFSLGTTPLMFTFGAMSTYLSKKFTEKLMIFSSILVILLGLGMLNTGFAMSGLMGFGVEKSVTDSFEPVVEDGVQIIKVEVSSNSYEAFTVKRGIPVEVNFHVEEENLNGCNNAILIPEYNLQIALSPGDNIVKFTPSRTGTIPYSCWMGMIKSSITVVE